MTIRWKSHAAELTDRSLVNESSVCRVLEFASQDDSPFWVGSEATQNPMQAE
jgi:hypothetical protein